MYSTLEGAKTCAKQLKRLLEEHGLIYPLAKCQSAVATAGGYRDWHDLMARIAQRPNDGLPYDYWGKLIAVLPEPCRRPIKSHLENEACRASDKWVGSVLPFALSLEGALRTTEPLLRPGSGKDQRLRLDIISGLLLNIEGGGRFSPKLDPGTLTIVLEEVPSAILSNLARHPRFDQALTALSAAGILKVGPGSTSIYAPEDTAIRASIIAKARSWKSQQEPPLQIYEMSRELAAALTHQADLDRAEAGPKVPYGELDYQDVSLSSRYSIAYEFKTMKAVVDAMPEQLRLRIESIWCDSKASAVYRVIVRLGMFHAQLPEQVRASFLAGSDGFNGLWVWHGSEDFGFDPEWPEDAAQV